MTRRTAVNVHDQPRQRIPFAVYEPVTGRLRVFGQAQRLTHAVCRSDPGIPPPLVDRLFDERKYRTVIEPIW